MSILVTPDYILGKHLVVGGGLEAQKAFCYVLFSHFLPFALGSVSLFTVTLLALERWCCVVYPLKFYKHFKNSKKMGFLIILVWLLGFSLSCILFTDVNFTRVHSNSSWQCSFKNLSMSDHDMSDHDPTEIFFACVEFLLGFLAPFFVSMFCLISLHRHLRRTYKDRAETSIDRERERSRKMVTKMATVTVIVMLVCWLPTHVTFFLYKVGHVSLRSGWLKATVMLCMSNACINPVIYLVTYDVYRDEFIKTLTCYNCRNREREQFPRLLDSITLIPAEDA